MRKLFVELTCILLLGAAALWAWPQVSGTLAGKITNQAGAPIPNAAITVTNVNTKISQKALSGPDGTFAMSGLPPGTYSVAVEVAGFKSAAQQNIELTTTGPVNITITLQKSTVTGSGTVELIGTAPQIQIDNGEVSVALDTRTVRELPIIDRNHQQLIGLQSGITTPVPLLDFAIDPDRNRFYSTNGQSPFVNENYLEGVWNQEPFRGTAVRVVPVEAVQQYSISTLNLTMEKGFTGGSFIMDNMRGGTNRWHGSAFEFWSGNALRTRNFFDTLHNDAPRFNYNQFGIAGGGPVIRDRTFLFGSWEGNFQRGGLTNISTVPVPGTLTGNFSGIPGLTLFNPFTGAADGTGRAAFAGNVIPAGSINPAAATIASFLPAPNQPGLVNNFISNAPFQSDYQKADARLDHYFSDRTSAFLRYGYSNLIARDPSPLGPVIGDGTAGRLVGQNAVISVTHAFNDRLITDFKFGYNRWDQRLSLIGDQTPLALALGTAGLGNGLVGIDIPGLPQIGASPFLPSTPRDNTFNWVWNWGLHTSRHSFKWGVDIRRIRSDEFRDSLFNPFGPNGTAFFGPGSTLLNDGTPLSANSEFYNSFAGFLLGAPSQVGQTSYLVPPSIRQSEYGIWVGDNFHLLHHLTIDAGVRYEVYSPLQARINGGAQIYDPTTNTFNYTGIGGVGQNISTWNTRNVAPRIGFAYSLNDKTVIRGGYGIQFFQFPYIFSGFSAPISGIVSGVQGTYSIAPLATPFGAFIIPPAPTPIVNGTPAGSLPVTVIPRSFPTPYVQTYSLQVQRDFYYGTVLSVGYMGTVDRHLIGIQQLNAALPGTGIAGLPFGSLGQFGSVSGFNNGLTSNYNSLQVNLNRRFAHGIAFLFSYTFAKALGFTDQNNVLLNPFNLQSNYGPLDFDRQHVLTFAHLWEIPWGRQGNGLKKTLLGGWQLNGILNWQTGTPLTFTADPLLCNCPGSTVLAGATSATGLVTGNFGNGQSFFNNGLFFQPVGTTTGGLSRGALRGPGFWNYNLSLFKNFRVWDRANVQLRGEAYNLANTTFPINPISNVNSVAFGQPNFGQPAFGVQTFGQDRGTLGAFGRQVNLALRVEF